MTKYIIRINNNEAIAGGDRPTFEDVKDEVGELLRSGYYEIEKFVEVPEVTTGD